MEAPIAIIPAVDGDVYLMRCSCAGQRDARRRNRRRGRQANGLPDGLIDQYGEREDNGPAPKTPQRATESRLQAGGRGGWGASASRAAPRVAIVRDTART